jgi:hypothetical protein
MTGTWHAAAGRRQALRAVSHADQSGITASILSRRPEEMWSYFCGASYYLTGAPLGA